MQFSPALSQDFFLILVKNSEDLTGSSYKQLLGKGLHAFDLLGRKNLVTESSHVYVVDLSSEAAL